MGLESNARLIGRVEPMAEKQELIFVTICPDNLYFHWQTEVYLTNFLKHGIPPGRIHCVYLVDPKSKPSEGLKALQRKYPVKWFIYDLVKSPAYLSLNIFTGLKQHVKQMEGKRVFFHDADIIFLRSPDLPSLSSLPSNKWYGSNVHGYNSAAYLQKRSETAFKEMCRMVGISPALVESKDDRVCGAQWIMDGMTYEFWNKCEIDALKIWNYLGDYNTKAPKEKQIQKTGMMWSMLWNAWLFDIDTEIRPELAFTFATSKIEMCTKVPILHNAGVKDAKDSEKFPKLAFRNKSPFGQNLSRYSKQFSSWRYVEAIKEVATNTII